jgi:hypothetical protein
MSEVPRIAILSALISESRAISRAVGNAEGVEFHVVGMKGVHMPKLAVGTIAIVAGLGGALDPALRVGDLVLDTPMEGLSHELPWHIGSIHTADRLVATVAGKSALFRETGALAVDMEQSTIRRALPNSARVIGIRAISDTAHMALDPAILGLIDATGRPKPLTVLATLARRPGLIPHLQTLNANSKMALRNLGQGVSALVRQLTA